MRATFAGAYEPMFLPNDSDSSAGEALASDATGEPSILPEASPDIHNLSDTPAEKTPRPIALRQTLPEPNRRTWAGAFGQGGTPMMRASVEQVP